MKIIKECQIAGQEYHISDLMVVLELNNTGRGYVVIAADEGDFVGKPVTIKVGTYDYFYQYLQGFVEQEQDEQPGYKKLLIKENAAKLERSLNCSIRHATLNDVCAFVTQQTGIAVKTPAQSYATTPIPNFTHSGSGYQLINKLGDLFNIPKYIWQQSPDGSIYVGSHNDSRWASRAITVDSADMLASGSNTITLPIYAAIRPGAIINNQVISKTELVGDELVLYWRESDSNGKPERKSPGRNMIEKEFPELAGGYHLPRLARVVGVADASSGGDISDPFRPKYAVEVQLLDENGNDEKVGVYSAVPLPVTSTGSQGGDFAFPEVGTIVELGFAYGRQDMPFVRTMLAQDKTVPAVAIGEQLKQQRPEVYERTDAAGNKTRETDQTITDKSLNRVIKTDTETKQIGTSTSEIDADKTMEVGGNLTTSVVGNITQVSASNMTVGVGGVLEQRISGLMQVVSEEKIRHIAPKSYAGSEGQNIYRILEEALQIIADVAATAASHTHGSSPTPSQSSAFASQSSRAAAEKAKLTPIIE
ncbi:hypothetical protein ACLQ9N_05140 [Gallibacterium anatis]|uniref:hypothetical protein n=1 Tax=Gallibacterium anatis TaxID=750 RepID=UPI0039FCEE1D